MDSIKGTDEKYLTVSELNWYVKQKFDRDPYLRQIFLQGELSNFRFRRGGHQYFSLKDDKSKINVVMFRGDFDKVKFEPEEGMKVYVTGERFRQLQEKLAKEGLFAQEHKRPLPLFPDKIAVVTSASGAVIHDIMVTANRRFPHAEIDLFPAQVQGESAAGSLVSAMQQIQARADEYDVLIIGRGGGSLEDLWPFNEEEVVRQVYAMKMPVISSVGHETDTTLCDLAADCRAATPTAAAEMATPDLTQVVAEISQLQTRLLTDIRAVIQVRAQALAQLENSFIMKEPQRLYEQKMQQVDQLSQQLSRMMEVIVKDQGQRLSLLTQRLQHQAPDRRIKQLKQESSYLAKSLEMGIKRILEQKQAACRQAVQQLDDYSPLKTLARGYSYTTDASGTVVKSVQQLSPGDQVRLHLKDGQAIGRIEEIKEEKND